MILINKILSEFVRKCGKKLDLKGIIQIGSSTYSENPDDFDLVFFSNKEVFPTKDYIKLLEIIKEFEAKYPEVVVDIAQGERKRKAKYKISVTPIQKANLKFNVDIFFLKNLSDDNNKKILFGKDPTQNLQIKFNEESTLVKLNLEINYRIRWCLDKETKLDAIYNLFKNTLRIMLINQGVLGKDELIDWFKKNIP